MCIPPYLILTVHKKIFCITDTIAFASLLNDFVMGPEIQPVLFQKEYGTVVLFYQCRGKIPCNHHFHIVVIKLNICHYLSIFQCNGFI